MAKHKKHNGKKKMTIPVAVIAGLAPGVTSVLDRGMNVGWKSAGNLATEIYTGYNAETGRFNFGSLKGGTMPLVIGFMIHKLAGMLGINRALASAGIPLVRI